MARRSTPGLPSIRRRLDANGYHGSVALEAWIHQDADAAIAEFVTLFGVDSADSVAAAAAERNPSKTFPASAAERGPRAVQTLDHRMEVDGVTKTVGIVGLGNMGFGMAANLLKAGFSVRGSDVRDEPKQRLVAAGGIAAATNAEVADGADAVFVMVVNEIPGPGCDLRQERPDRDLAPGVDGHRHRHYRSQACAGPGTDPRRQGHPMIDSGVSGGLPAADAGTLTLMAAGRREVFEENLDVMLAVGDPTPFST